MSAKALFDSLSVKRYTSYDGQLRVAGDEGLNLKLGVFRLTLTIACTVDGLPEGAIKKFAGLGKDILLVKKDGQIYTMNDLCTHTGEDLVKRYLERINETDAVVCPRHRAKFEISSGRVLRPPAQGMRIDTLKTYSVVDGNEAKVDIS